MLFARSSSRRRVADRQHSWSPRGSRDDLAEPFYFSVIRTSARIQGWMQHWYFSTPASCSVSLDDPPEGISTAFLHSGATVVNPTRSFRNLILPPPNSSTSVNVCVSPPRLLATSSWPTRIVTSDGAKCHAPTE